MKARLEDKYKAIELRKTGPSYKEIQQTIPVSKGLLSGWFKYLDFSPKEIEFLKSRISERQNTGRINAALSNRKRRIEREEKNFESAKMSFDQHMNNLVFIIGVSLYWAEGSKRTSDFQFINSDENMVLFMYKWAQKYLKIERGNIKCRLFTHKIPGHEKNIKFWSNLLDIDESLFQKTIFKPTIHTIKKNPNYNGCLRITISGIDQLRTMKNWQKLMMEYYGNFV